MPACHQQCKPAQSAFSGLRALPSALSVCPQHSACPQHCCSAFSCHCSQLLCLSLPPLTELCSFQTKIMGTTSSSGAQSCPKTRLRPNKASARFKGQYHSGGRLAGPRAGSRLPPPPYLPPLPPLPSCPSTCTSPCGVVTVSVSSVWTCYCMPAAQCLLLAQPGMPARPCVSV